MVSRAIVPSRFSARALFAVQSREAGERASGSVLRNAGFAALVAVAYYAGTRLGFVLTPPGYAISVFWPPNAILLAALLLAPVPSASLDSHEENRYSKPSRAFWYF